jgi:hypothetical protein
MINLDKDTLEKACKEIIETILFCLSNAYKGTVYHIGPPPELRAVRVASGIIDERREKIEWELEGSSDFDPPGKSWLEYRDEPNRPLEAMAHLLVMKISLMPMLLCLLGRILPIIIQF